MRDHARRQFGVLLEKNVPMTTRDGVTLYADVWHPDAPGTFPVLLSRTPYGKESAAQNPNGSNAFFARFGYVTVMQDCRGRFTSEDNYNPVFQEVADGYDAVEWAARLPWANGRVGTCGQSYLGATQYAIAGNDPMPPSLQAMVPVSASSDFHQSWVHHTGGASMWGWLVPYAIFKGRNTLERAGRQDLLAKLDDYVDPATNFSMPLKDHWFRHRPISDWIDLLKETAPYFADYIREADDGPFWDSINLNIQAPHVSVPMLHVSSWYDIFLEGALNGFQSISRMSQFARARSSQKLVIGPWAHLFPFVVPTSGGTGDIDFGAEALIDLHQLQLRWFDYWLKDIDTGVMDEPPVSVFTMGENRWETFDAWPPPKVRSVRWFLHSSGEANTVTGDGTLSTVPPGGEASDRFTYDPSNPVPTLGGNNLSIPLGVKDQRPVENRPDVLVFTAEAQVAPMQVTGPITVELWASSSTVDTDFTAKLVDVHPDGYAQNLADGVIRARYRNSSRHPEPMAPGTPYRFTIDLWATSHVFLPGHRLRLEISSSNFPRFDANPNTGEPFGDATDAITANQTVFHQPGMESFILLPVMPR